MIRLYLGVSALLAVAMLLLPLLPQQLILYVGVEGFALVLSLIAAFRAPQVRLLAASFVCFFIGDLTYVYFDLIKHETRSFPNVGDAFYLAFYPLAALGLILLVRKDFTSTLDSILITLGLAVPWWLFIEYPNVSAPGYSVLERVVTVAYPLGDLLLIFLVVRVLFFEVPRSVLYLGAGLIFLAATDSIYSIEQLRGTFQHGSWLDAGWFLFYVLWGLAFLYPFSSSKAELRVSVSNSRSVLLFTSILLPTISIFIGLAIGGQRESLGYLIGVCVIVLVMTVVAILRARQITDKADR